MEVAVRIFTTTNEANVELFMGLKHRYLLPLPVAADKYYEEGISIAGADSYRGFDDTLGWSHNAWGVDTTGAFRCFANDKGIRINQASWQRRDTARKHYDIITIGNSFTHGDAVAAEDSWPYLLSKKTQKTVANLGVGGYGLQQALLRLMHSGITADTVIFGAIWGDFERALEPVYTFYQGGNKTRPVFHFTEDGGYSLVNVPVLRPEEFYRAKSNFSKVDIFYHIPGFDQTVFSDALWTKSYFLRLLVSIRHQRKHFKEKPIYLTEGPDLEHCMNIFQLFHDYCEKNGSFPLIVLLDTGQNFAHKQTWSLENPWHLVHSKMRDRSLYAIDFHQDLFSAYSHQREKLIHPVENLHYSPAGNEMVADLIIAKYFNTSINK